MAIVKFGQTVVGVRGTLGGIVYSANHTGAYARAWSKGSNPRSPYQQMARANITPIGGLWASLSDGDRADWDNFGLHPPEVDTNTLGEVILLSGWQWFVRINQRLQVFNQGLNTSLPSADPVLPATSSILTVNVTDTPYAAITWQPRPLPDSPWAIVHMAVHPTVGLTNKSVGSKIVGYNISPSEDVMMLGFGVSLRFPGIQKGWKCFSRLYCVRGDGVRSTASLATTEVT